MSWQFVDSPSRLIEAVAVISRHPDGITSNSMRFSKPRPKALTVFVFSFQASDPRLTGRAHRVARAHGHFREKKSFTFSKGIPFFSAECRNRPVRIEQHRCLIGGEKQVHSVGGLQRIKRFLEVRDPPRYRQLGLKSCVMGNHLARFEEHLI